MLQIVTLDYKLKGEGIYNSSILSSHNLLDADMVVCSPLGASQLFYQNAEITSSDEVKVFPPYSIRLEDAFHSRSRDLHRFLYGGKIVVTFLHPVQKFTLILPKGNMEIDSHDFLPENPISKWDVVGGIGVLGKTQVNNSNNNILKHFHSAFESQISYQAYLNIDYNEIPGSYILNRANQPVAAVFGVGDGLLVFLPHLEKGDIDKKLSSVLVGIGRKFYGKITETPPPNWIKEYDLFGEEKLEKEITQTQQEIDALVNKRKTYEQEKSSLVAFKGLLYEKGHPLENIVLRAFRLIGFEAENRNTGNVEHDIVFSSPEGKGIAEVEGKDKDWISVGKFDQLTRAVDEDYEITEEWSEGILIGNPFRLLPPYERLEPPFTPKAISVAKRKNFSLLTTIQLYQAVEYILEHPADEEFKKACRNAILGSQGEQVIFPLEKIDPTLKSAAELSKK